MRVTCDVERRGDATPKLYTFAEMKQRPSVYKLHDTDMFRTYRFVVGPGSSFVWFDIDSPYIKTDETLTLSFT